MGCAREIAKRRDQLSSTSAHPDQSPPHTAPMDEIIRYLRQQDVVAVPQEDGSYLVNGRFRMSVAEVFARANRMRTRRQSTAFESELLGEKLAPIGKNSSANGHPLFWEKPTAPESPS
jgi:hypothetical protein